MVSNDSWIHFRPLVKCLDCSSQSWWLGNPPNVQRSGQIELKTCVHFTKTPSRLVGICFLFLWNSFDDVWIRFVTKTFQTSLLVILISTRDTHNLSYAYVLMSQGTKEIQGRHRHKTVRVICTRSKSARIKANLHLSGIISNLHFLERSSVEMDVAWSQKIAGYISGP